LETPFSQSDQRDGSSRRKQSEVMDTKQKIEDPTSVPGTPPCLVVHCAACSRRLGSVSNEGWLWTGAPARLVNRKRFVTLAPVHTEPPSAPPDNFRIRTVQRARFEDPEYTIWEYPYTCDSDTCMSALGPEWNGTAGGADGPPFKLMPAGRVLS
jgi:hypothetical protein